MKIESQFFDHRHIYLNKEIFYPIAHREKDVAEKTNTIILELDGKNTSLLQWEKHLDTAKKYIEKGYYILWEIDLGLCEKRFPIEDEMYFQSLKRALDYFTQTVWSQFYSYTFGVSLYRGKIPQFFHQENNPSSLFQMNLLSEYLHLLAPCLPDEVIMMAFLDLSEIHSKSELIHLTSKDLFEFFLLAVKGEELSYSVGLENTSWMGAIDLKGGCFSEKKEVNVGVYFPTDPIYKELDELFTSLDQHNISYRILFERYATEQWDEIDYMIFPKGKLSGQGNRMLQGFCAAGGIPVSINEPMGVDQEISYKEFLKNRDRGIRTPDLLVPNQTR